MARARSEEKRDAIVAAAVRLFTDRGFDGASMDQITAAAGVSKATLYAHFTDKDALFAAAMEAACAAAPSADPVPGDADLETALRGFAAPVLDRYASEAGFDLLRLALAEAARRPSVAAIFWSAGPGRAAAALGEHLKRLAKAEGRSARGAREAARAFIARLAAGPLQDALLNGARPPRRAALEAALEADVADFIRRWRRPEPR